MTEADDGWVVECSDEEVDAAFGEGQSGECRPLDGAAAIEAYRAVLRARAGETVLSWSCQFGRRPPTPQSFSDSPSEDEEVVLSHVDTSGFDFSDESSSVRLQPRRLHGAGGTPKGSAKKKTTSFENILASVRRQKNIEAREKNTRFKK